MHNFVKNIGGLPPLLVWVPFLIVNNYSEFKVNIFSNNRDIKKCQKFSHNAGRQGYDKASKTGELKISFELSSIFLLIWSSALC